jgi:hypothetical protein
MKFRHYSYEQKSLDKFIHRIKETFGSDILIGYGNWSLNTTNMKYYEPTMNKGIRKLIHKKYDTVTINEFNTSRMCCECHKNLVHHKLHFINEKNEKKEYTEHRLLKCIDCIKPNNNSSNSVSCENKRIVFRTRDYNSAVNIRNITKLWIDEQKRLPVFSRIINSKV